MQKMSKTSISFVAAAFAVALTGACGGGGEKKPDKKVAKDKTPEKKAAKKAEPKPADEKPREPDPKVAKAASIAKEIEANPDKTDEILGKHDLDRDKFEAMIMEIAKNAEMSSDYEDLLVET